MSWNLQRNKTGNQIQEKQYSSVVKPFQISYNAFTSRENYVENNTAKKLPETYKQYDEMELWQDRCTDLENQINHIKTDLQVSTFKVKKLKEIEDKNEFLSQQNSLIVHEKEQALKIATQKKAESEIWKQKYESQMNQLIDLKTNYELEIRHLNGEISKMQDQINQMKVLQFNESEQQKGLLAENQHEQILKLKQDHCQEIALLEEQLQKQRDIIQQQEIDNQQLRSQVHNTRNNGQKDLAELGVVNEKLQLKVCQIELENKQDMDKQLQKSIDLLKEQLENQKICHQSQIEVQNGQIDKLKKIIELNNEEIDNLIQQNKNEKINHQQEQELLRIEIKEFKDQLSQNNEIKEKDIKSLSLQLAELHSTDIYGLKFHHENQIDALNREIENLKSLMPQKSQEINQQIKEKLDQRQNHLSECLRLKEDIAQWKEKYSQLDQQKQNQEKQKQNQNDYIQKDYELQLAQCKQHIKLIQIENQNHQSLIKSLNQDNEERKKQHDNMKQTYEDDIQKLNFTIQDLDNNLSKLQHNYDNLYEEFNAQQQIYQQKIEIQNKQLEDERNSKKQEIDKINSAILIQQRECQNLLNINKLQENDIRKLRTNEIERNNHIVNLEKQKNIEIEDLRAKMEKDHQFAVEALKKAQGNTLNIQNQEIQDLLFRLDLKEKEIQDLVLKYQKLELALRDFIEFPDRIKDFAEIVTTKNLYDVKCKTQQKSPTKRYK